MTVSLLVLFKSASEHPVIVSKNILKEVSLGRAAGPFSSPPFVNFQVYPIGVVPKKRSSDWRTIFDFYCLVSTVRQN